MMPRAITRVSQFTRRPVAGGVVFRRFTGNSNQLAGLFGGDTWRATRTRMFLKTFLHALDHPNLPLASRSSAYATGVPCRRRHANHERFGHSFCPPTKAGIMRPRSARCWGVLCPRTSRSNSSFSRSLRVSLAALGPRIRLFPPLFVRWPQFTIRSPFSRKGLEPSCTSCCLNQ
jgi:hypothetical protein